MPKSKTDLVACLQLRLSKKDAEDAVNALFAYLADGLQRGEEFRIHGFGTFSIKTRAARTGRNPITGAQIQIAAKKSVHFKSVPSLNESLR